MWTKFTSIKKYYKVKSRRIQAEKAFFDGVWRSYRTQKQMIKARGHYAFMVSKARRKRQREKRKEKRRLKRQLKIQNAAVKERCSIGEYKMLGKRFWDYAINSTKSEIKNGEIEPEREALLRNVISLRNKLNPTERRVQR
jgi:hypothetical protein